MKTMTLKSYLAGLKDHNGKFIDWSVIRIAGEDIVNDRMLISIEDLPGWIKSGAKFELRMPKEDIELLKDYFKKL